MTLRPNKNYFCNRFICSVKFVSRQRCIISTVFFVVLSQARHYWKCSAGKIYVVPAEQIGILWHANT